ncbi:COG4223 family protein [Sphingomonas sp.]|uniref:COG4223 family protein n=1 Tax=Sphingomonas sp. TaxID=28214 RepID=UPI003B3A26B4
MGQPELYGATRRRLPYALLAIALIAFLLGIAATAYAVHRWDRIAGLIRPTPKPVIVTRSVPVRVAPRAAPPPSEAALSERLAAIESRVDALNARSVQASGDVDRAEGLLVAFAARRAVDRGQPLGYIEGLLRDCFGGTDAASVVQIIAASQNPVTLGELRDGLAKLRPTLVATGSNQHWWQGLRREMSSLFVLRRADQPSTIPADRLARAQQALEEGQVDVAAAEIARMPGAARAVDWLAQARRYLLAHNALDRIESAALLKPKPKIPVIPVPVAAIPAPTT